MTWPLAAISNQWTHGEEIDEVKLQARVDARLNALLPYVATRTGELGVATNAGVVTVVTSTTIIATKTVPVVAGRIYKISGIYSGVGAGGSGNITTQLFGPSGTLNTYLNNATPFTSTGPVNGTAFTTFTAGSTGTAAFSIAGATNANSVTVGVGVSTLLIEDMNVFV